MVYAVVISRNTGLGMTVLLEYGSTPPLISIASHFVYGGDDQSGRTPCERTTYHVHRARDDPTGASDQVGCGVLREPVWNTSATRAP